VIAYEDLGAEAIYKLEVEDFPVIVVMDCEGINLNDWWWYVLIYSKNCKKLLRKNAK